ncbi:hypothetical protein [Streptomyces sp. NPDC059063]|uniref:hypothetical protein n=1 Tax=unclassified Streptomyces TaxID=2593676 RepID=UPI0036B84570
MNPHPRVTGAACRLVHRWVTDKGAFLSRVRGLLAPGGTFWGVTSVHDPGQRQPEEGDLRTRQAALLTASWSRLHLTELDPAFHCYALQP